MINIEAFEESLNGFLNGEPFDHCVVDGFLEPRIAQALAGEFPEYNSPAWFYYNNSIENKKALNSWEAFPALTYQIFSLLYSPKVIGLLEKVLGKKVYPDHGLNGGGWHIHGHGGNLNPHVDYSIHPKLKLQRMINIIIYLSEEMKPEYGGHIGFWEHDPDNNAPGKLVKEFAPTFNRAVIFNTSQNSWHGMSRSLTMPDGVLRKSLAIYYLCEPEKDAPPRGRALFAPREEQKSDQSVLETIKLRSDVATSREVYNTKKDV